MILLLRPTLFPYTTLFRSGDRSGVVIEPYLTDQWYVDAKTLAQPAIAAVRSGATTFVPKNWEKTYFEWMENIQPWCISDRKSTRLNSSHLGISYAVFCLKN